MNLDRKWNWLDKIFWPSKHIFRSVSYCINHYKVNCDFSYAFSESWCDLAITVYVALFITSKWDYPCITWDFRIWSYQSETLSYKFCIAYNQEKESKSVKIWLDLTRKQSLLWISFQSLLDMVSCVWWHTVTQLTIHNLYALVE